MDSNELTIIKPRSGWQCINFRELTGYQDLLFFLVWRDIKVLYAQTILGFAWAIMQPSLEIITFTVVFGKVAKVSTDGIPYVLFSSVAIIPWTYLSSAITASSQSLVAGATMLGKVYFPRLIFPISPVLSKLVDFCISLLIIIIICIYYRVSPTWNILLFPLVVFFMICLSAGVGMWFSAMAIRFRDVKFAMPFVIRTLMYTAPILYSASSVPEKYRIIYSLNPIVGIIEGSRACLLGTPVSWLYVIPGFLITMIILVSGALYFKHMERIFADVI